MAPAHPPAAAAGPSVPTTLRTPPALDHYTPLAEHQSRTPTSFFDGPPVLHWHAAGARAFLSRDQRAKLPWGASDEAAADPSGPAMGDAVQHIVDVFAGSDSLSIYCPSAAVGVALPYPVIGLHAIQSAHAPDGRRVPTVYMQLELGSGDDDEGETVELSLVPAAPPPTPTEAAVDAPPQSVSEASQLFDAISACADLHPDPHDDDDGDAYPSFFQEGADEEDDDYVYDDAGSDDGFELVEGFPGVFRGPAATTSASAADLPPPMPGSGGWITAENVHVFFDDEGNWRGRNNSGPLGEGAGRVRDRSEAEAAPSATVAAAAGAVTENGSNVNGDGAESKRQRTE